LIEKGYLLDINSFKVGNMAMLDDFYMLKNKKIMNILIISLFTILVSFSYSLTIFAVDDIEYFPLTINDVEVLGEGGINKILFSRGEDVFIKVTVEKPLSYYLLDDMVNTTDYIVIVTVMDKDRTPIHIGIVESSIELGEIWDISLSFSLPSDAVFGMYHITALVWDEAGIPLSNIIQEVDFYVA